MNKTNDVIKHDVLLCLIELIEDNSVISQVSEANANNYAVNYYGGPETYYEIALKDIKNILIHQKNPMLTNAIDGSRTYENYKDFVAPLKKSNSVTLLVTCLVTQDHLASVKKNLKDLAIYFDDYHLIPNHVSQLIEAKVEPLYLVNLFITNNMSPQKINLGYDVFHNIAALHQFSNIKFCDYIKDTKSQSYEISGKAIKQLVKPYYLWHFDKQMTYLTKDLVILDKNTDNDKIKKQIVKEYQKQVDWELNFEANKKFSNLTDEYETATSVSAVYLSMHGAIEILDLAWLMRQLHNDPETEIGYLDQNDKNQPAEINAIVNYLADQLN